LFLAAERLFFEELNRSLVVQTVLGLGRRANQVVIGGSPLGFLV